ncbi:MAG: nuclear transport factor 2 family protein [Solirubrobacteraceae bacterium]
MGPTVKPASGRKPPAGYRAKLGHRAPERLAVEYKRRFDAHDLDGVRDLHAEGFVMVDHRAHNSTDAEEEWRPEYGSLDVRIELEEVLACDERVIAMRATVRGTSPDGEQFEVPLGLVDVTENGLFTSADRYDPENRDAMLARYTELGGTLTP